MPIAAEMEREADELNRVMKGMEVVPPTEEELRRAETASAQIRCSPFELLEFHYSV